MRGHLLSKEGKERIDNGGYPWRKLGGGESVDSQNKKVRGSFWR